MNAETIRTVASLLGTTNKTVILNAVVATLVAEGFDVADVLAVVAGVDWTTFVAEVQESLVA